MIGPCLSLAVEYCITIAWTGGRDNAARSGDAFARPRSCQPFVGLNRMNYIGSIRAADGQAPIEHPEWMNYIASVDDLHRPPGRPGRNPADGKPVVLRPPADAVNLIVDGNKIGSFSWGPPEYSCINVESMESHRSLIVKRAIEIADRLGGVFTDWNGDP